MGLASVSSTGDRGKDINFPSPSAVKEKYTKVIMYGLYWSNEYSKPFLFALEALLIKKY